MAPVFSRIVEVSTLLLALGSHVDAFWRLPCQARSGLARIDPIINPGDVGSHAHAIHGGSNFGMSSGYDDLMKSNCTSCAVKQDHSAYWTPALYFMGKDGKTEIVDQNGGTLVYYLLYGDKVKAFPPGFQMIAGDTNRRSFSLPVPDPPQSSWSGEQSTQSALAQKAVGFNCLDYGRHPEGSLYRHFLPDKAYLDANCKNGVRFELMFPSCWNGKDIDSHNHQSHMQYPSTVKDGTCPPGFETRLISLFYETIWDTQKFAGRDGKFVISNGDDSGYGYHGDFMTGWDPNFLQRAVDTCTNLSGRVEDCPLFAPELQSLATQAQCAFETPAQLAKDDCKGPRQGLPGDVPIQVGPSRATNVPISGAKKDGAPPKAASNPVVTPSSRSSSSTTLPSLGYSSGTPISSGAVFAVKSPSVSVALSSSVPARTSPTTSITPVSPVSSVSSVSSVLSVSRVVPELKLVVENSKTTTAPQTPTTPAPSFASTIWSTNGASVYEIFVVNTEITTTISMTATSTIAAAATNPAYKPADQAVVPDTKAGSGYKRRHVHQHHGHHGVGGAHH